MSKHVIQDADGNLTIIEILDNPKSLNPLGALATLLAVTGAVSVEDAANAVGLSPTDLIAEAEAWAVVANDGNVR